jgi:hypothetical protein
MFPAAGPSLAARNSAVQSQESNYLQRERGTITAPEAAAAVAYVCISNILLFHVLYEKIVQEEN